MYLLTKLGFFSIVRKTFDPIKGEEVKSEEYQVRGVELQDMYNLLNAYKVHPSFDAHQHHVPHVHETHYSNYRYRMQVKPDEMKIMLQVLLENIDYMNFIKEISKHPDQVKKGKLYQEFRNSILSIQND